MDLRLGAPGVAQDCFLRGSVDRRTVGGEERLRLARGEGVALDGLGKPSLLGGGEDRQRAGERERQSAAVDARGEVGRESAGEGQATVHPGVLLAQELRDRGHGVSVLVGEGQNDAGLVHGADGLGRRVGLEKPRLHGGAVDRLDHDGHFGAAFPSPEGQALEAVEDLAGAVAGPGDAQRESRQRRGVGPFPAQRRQGRPQLRDRHEFNERHGGPPRAGSGRGDSGKR